MANQFTFLQGEELRCLAKLVYYQEAEKVQNIKFNSENERAKYLQESKACYESALGLLDSGEELKRDYDHDKDKTRSDIAHKIFSGMEWSVNFSFQCVYNYTVRRSCLTKIIEHSKTLSKALQDLNPASATNVGLLAKEAVKFENAMSVYAIKYQSPVLSSFSRWLKSESITFQNLLIRFMNKLNFEGPFKNLQDAQKLQVYEEIMAASGRGRGLAMGFSEGLGAAGVALLLLTAGIMVWDVYTSDHKFKTATHDVVVTTTLIGGATLGKIVGAALVTEFVGAEATVFGVTLVTVGGILGGFAGAFIFSTISGWLIDKLFSTGDDSHLTHNSSQSQHFYVAPMPDSKALALQIAHHQPTTSTPNYA